MLVCSSGGDDGVGSKVSVGKGVADGTGVFVGTGVADGSVVLDGSTVAGVSVGGRFTLLSNVAAVVKQVRINTKSNNNIIKQLFVPSLKFFIIHPS